MCILIIITITNVFFVNLKGHNIKIEPNLAVDVKKSQKYTYSSQYWRYTKIGQYKDHGPIFINGDADFNATVRAENWLGNGTSQNPFVIEDLRITGLPGSSLIKIWNTDFHFQITNCFLDGGLSTV